MGLLKNLVFSGVWGAWWRGHLRLGQAVTMPSKGAYIVHDAFQQGLDNKIDDPHQTFYTELTSTYLADYNSFKQAIFDDDAVNDLTDKARNLFDKYYAARMVSERLVVLGLSVDDEPHNVKPIKEKLGTYSNETFKHIQRIWEKLRDVSSGFENDPTLLRRKLCKLDDEPRKFLEDKINDPVQVPKKLNEMKWPNCFREDANQKKRIVSIWRQFNTYAQRRGKARLESLNLKEGDIRNLKLRVGALSQESFWTLKTVLQDIEGIIGPVKKNDIGDIVALTPNGLTSLAQMIDRSYDESSQPVQSDEKANGGDKVKNIYQKYFKAKQCLLEKGLKWHSVFLQGREDMPGQNDHDATAPSPALKRLDANLPKILGCFKKAGQLHRAKKCMSWLVRMASRRWVLECVIKGNACVLPVACAFGQDASDKKLGTNIYDLESLERWLIHCQTNPVTRKPMTSAHRELYRQYSNPIKCKALIRADQEAAKEIFDDEKAELGNSGFNF